MKRVWIMAMALVFMAAIAGGSLTLALFSAQSPPQDAIFTSGTLAIDAQRDQGDGIPGPLFYIESAGSAPWGHPTHLWAPGDSHFRILQIENVGSLDARLVSLSTAKESGSDLLAGILDVKVTLDEAGTEILASGKLSEFIAGLKTFPAVPDRPDGSNALEIMPGDITQLYFHVSLPLSAGNEYQGLTTVVSFTVYADQMKNNP